MEFFNSVIQTDCSFSLVSPRMFIGQTRFQNTSVFKNKFSVLAPVQHAARGFAASILTYISHSLIDFWAKERLLKVYSGSS